MLEKSQYSCGIVILIITEYNCLIIRSEHKPGHFDGLELLKLERFSISMRLIQPRMRTGHRVTSLA